jgi:hypothetical protein
MEEAMKNAITRILYAGFIFFTCFCLTFVGCKKKPPNPGEKFGWVQGHVKDAADSTFIVGAGIFVGSEPDTAQFITETDSTGYYKFADFATTLQITASAEGYKPQTKTVEIIVNQTTRLDFFLNRK